MAAKRRLILLLQVMVLNNVKMRTVKECNFHCAEARRLTVADIKAAVEVTPRVAGLVTLKIRVTRPLNRFEYSVPVTLGNQNSWFFDGYASFKPCIRLDDGCLREAEAVGQDVPSLRIEDRNPVYFALLSDDFFIYTANRQVVERTDGARVHLQADSVFNSLLLRQVGVIKLPEKTHFVQPAAWRDA